MANSMTAKKCKCDLLGYDSDLCTMKRLQKALVRALMGLGFTITYIDPGVFYAYVDEHRLISDPCGAC